VTDARWMLEELRISLFAQTLGTLAPVSENRVLAALDRLG
jgi:ATP-dependent helicase HrpA